MKSYLYLLTLSAIAGAICSSCGSHHPVPVEDVNNKHKHHENQRQRGGNTEVSVTLLQQPDAWSRYNQLPEAERPRYLDTCYSYYDNELYDQAYNLYQQQATSNGWTMWYPERYLQTYSNYHKQTRQSAFICEGQQPSNPYRGNRRY
jgi:hypothetical protein